MSEYSILGRTIDPNHPEFQTMLRQAYDKRGRVLCLCRQQGVLMYIAHVGHEFIVKRLPNTGKEHAPDCDRFEVPLTLSGKAEVLGQAIVEDPATETAKLKFAFALTKGRERQAPSGDSAPGLTVRLDPKRLSLRGLLDYLWEESELTLMAPGFAGKRHWGLVRKLLWRAADAKSSQHFQLRELLFIPPTYFLDHKEQLAADRHRIFTSAGAAKHKMIVIGLVKSLDPARLGGKLTIKHMPDAPLFLSDKMFKAIPKRFAAQLDLWRLYDKSHLIAIATIAQTPSGLLSIHEIAFMNVTDNWIPFQDHNEKRLIEVLTEAQRRFVKTMRFNMPPIAPMAFGVLTDTGERGTPLFIVPTGAAQAVCERFEELMKSCELDSWCWEAIGPRPTLPPKAR